MCWFAAASIRTQLVFWNFWSGWFNGEKAYAWNGSSGQQLPTAERCTVQMAGMSTHACSVVVRDPCLCVHTCGQQMASSMFILSELSFPRSLVQLLSLLVLTLARLNEGLAFWQGHFCVVCWSRQRSALLGTRNFVFSIHIEIKLFLFLWNSREILVLQTVPRKTIYLVGFNLNRLCPIIVGLKDLLGFWEQKLRFCTARIYLVWIAIRWLAPWWARIQSS